jgi:hypothetical protein
MLRFGIKTALLCGVMEEGGYPINIFVVMHLGLNRILHVGKRLISLTVRRGVFFGGTLTTQSC